MRVTSRGFVCGIVLCACALGYGSGTGVEGQGRPEAPRRVRALVISAGAFHDYLYQTTVLVQAIGKTLPVDWTIALQGVDPRTDTRFPVYDSPDWAKGFDVVIHNECSADVSDETFIRTITGAHRTVRVPAMVVHCAMHSYRAARVDDWREFLGVTTRAHTPQFRIPVKWVSDPVTAGLTQEWITPSDELYIIEKVWPGVRPLATAVDPKTQREYAVAWANDYHGVRVFGTTLGHGNVTWDDPVFQELLTRGFKWAVGR